MVDFRKTATESAIHHKKRKPVTQNPDLDYVYENTF